MTARRRNRCSHRTTKVVDTQANCAEGRSTPARLTRGSLSSSEVSDRMAACTNSAGMSRVMIVIEDATSVPALDPALDRLR